MCPGMTVSTSTVCFLPWPCLLFPPFAYSAPHTVHALCLFPLPGNRNAMKNACNVCSLGANGASLVAWQPCNFDRHGEGIRRGWESRWHLWARHQSGAASHTVTATAGVTSVRTFVGGVSSSPRLRFVKREARSLLQICCARCDNGEAGARQISAAHVLIAAVSEISGMELQTRLLDSGGLKERVSLYLPAVCSSR